MPKQNINKHNNKNNNCYINNKPKNYRTKLINCKMI